MKITTNNIPRAVICGFELTEKQRAEFDYLDDIDSATFFAYKGQIYDLGEFMRVEPGSAHFAGWGGYSPDGFFSGVVVRYVDDYEQVIVGTYYA
jgi:hypothetical protein